MKQLHRLPGRNSGMSLIELMIGMVIGLVALLVIQQMVVNFDSQKRASSAGGDAQNTGMVAMFMIENDLRQAGFGLSTLNTLGCTIHSNRIINGRRMMPILIIPAGTSAGANPLGIAPGDIGTDIIAVMYGHSPTIVEGEPITAHTSGTQYSMGNISGMSAGDFVLAAESGKDCSLGQIQGPLVSAAPSFSVDYNSPVAYTINSKSSRIFHLGRRMSINVYAIRGGNLTVCDYWTKDCAASDDAATWTTIASNVVGLRAQYAWDTSSPLGSVSPAGMTADVFCRGRPPSNSTACADPNPYPGAIPAIPSTQCDFARITAIQLVLIARSSEPAPGSEPASLVSPAELPVFSASATTPVSNIENFATPDRHYRYKTFSTTVPFRNNIWLGSEEWEQRKVACNTL